MVYNRVLEPILKILLAAIAEFWHLAAKNFSA